MSLYLLDTDHVTLHQRNYPPVIARVQRVTSEEELATTVVTVEEQMRGRLAQLRQSKANLSLVYNQLRTTVDYFCDLKIFPFDREAQQQFQRLRSQKIRVSTLDLRIAAIALTQNGIVVTRNKRDFARVPGLRLEDWSHPV